MLVSFYFLVISGKLFRRAVHQKEIINITEMLRNPDEYVNSIFLGNLTSVQKNYVINSLNRLLYEKCKYGKLNENCTTYFLYYYTKTRNTLGGFPEAEYNNTLKTIRSTYFDLYYKFGTLTEDDLKGFVVPLLAQFCNMQVINSTGRFYWLTEMGRTYWAKEIIDVNKTSLQSTDMQIFYLQSCMRVLNITQLSKKTGMDLKELNSKMCNMLPNLKNINTEDLCYVSDYLNMKKFCEARITAEDKVFVEGLLSKEYESYYQKDCMNKLSRTYMLSNLG